MFILFYQRGLFSVRYYTLSMCSLIKWNRKYRSCYELQTDITSIQNFLLKHIFGTEITTHVFWRDSVCLVDVWMPPSGMANRTERRCLSIKMGPQGNVASVKAIYYHFVRSHGNCRARISEANRNMKKQWVTLKYPVLSCK